MVGFYFGETLRTIGLMWKRDFFFVILNMMTFQWVQTHAGRLCRVRIDTVSGEFTSPFYGLIPEFVLTVVRHGLQARVSAGLRNLEITNGLKIKVEKG
jgi:hypothetical protein